MDENLVDHHQELTIWLEAPDLTLEKIADFTGAMNRLLSIAIAQAAVPALTYAGGEESTEEQRVELLLIDVAYGSFFARLRPRADRRMLPHITAAVLASAVWITGGCVATTANLPEPERPSKLVADADKIREGAQYEAGGAVEKFLQSTPQFHAQIRYGDYFVDLRTDAYQGIPPTDLELTRQQAMRSLATAALQLQPTESAKVLRTLADLQDGKIDQTKPNESGLLKDIFAPLAQIAGTAFSLLTLLKLYGILDKLKINTNDKSEVEFWTKAWGVTVEQLINCVKKTGGRAKDVQTCLKHGVP